MSKKNRPPAHVRDQVDLGFRITDQSIVLFESRPKWNDPSKITEVMQAKATYVKKTNTWKVYCQRADLKWHSYQPNPEVDTLEQFLVLVGNDEHCYFN